MTAVTRFALTLSLLLLAMTATAQTQPARVVTSIAPLHSLASAVMQGRGEPLLLLRGAASPHRYALRPSDARALQQADLVIWVGPHLETFLDRALPGEFDRSRLLTLASVPGLLSLPIRSGGLWEDEHDHEHGHGHSPAAGDLDLAGMDPHYWLDPDNARRWLEAIEQRLSQIDPAGAADYARNRAAYDQRLQALDGQLRTRLAPLAQRPFLVFHDAYQYFEQHYGLMAIGSVAVASGRTPGVRRVLQIRQRMRESGAVCLFSEPQFEPRLASRLIENTEVRPGVLDPLGAATEPGPGHYPQLLLNLVEALEGCLTP